MIIINTLNVKVALISLAFMSVIPSLNRSCLWTEENVVLDYGGLRKYQHRGKIIVPESLSTAISIFQSAKQQSIFRIRGAGHSTHLASIPRNNEVLLTTLNLNQVSFPVEGIVRCQSGVQVGVLQRFLHSLGWQLPVIHSGDEIGPTIGGYFMAGGFGEGSRVYGGFWANVNSLYWLDFQTQQVKRIDRDCDEFWRISGSGLMPNGLILELDLKVLPINKSSVYPFEYSTLLPWHYGETSAHHIIWQTVFAPASLSNHLFSAFRRKIPLLAQAWQRPMQRSLEIKNIDNMLPYFLSSLEGDLVALSIGGELKEPRELNARMATSIFSEILSAFDFCIPYASCELGCSTLI